jgi:hypothetical protein
MMRRDRRWGAWGTFRAVVGGAVCLSGLAACEAVLGLGDLSERGPDASVRHDAAGSKSDAHESDDSGHRDAGHVYKDAGHVNKDAEHDAGQEAAAPVCEAGAVCIVGSCHTGFVSCTASGGSNCVGSVVAANGTTCDAGADAGGGACNNGVCGACANGSSCAAAGSCVAAAISCATGTGVCITGGNAPNGFYCNPGMYCSDGVCAACVPGAPCVPRSTPCNIGSAVCTADGGLSCISTGGVAEAGTACGPNKVCNAAQQCVACTIGAACDAGVCTTASTSCGDGVPACTPTAALSNGTACGSNHVCNDGGCNACVPNTPCSPMGNACLTGTTSCVSGYSVCNMTGVADAATPCEGGPTCNGQGQCGTACTIGAPCFPQGDTCENGTTTCPENIPVCTPTTDVENGTACGTGGVCCGGQCSTCSGTLGANAAWGCSNNECAQVCTGDAAACPVDGGGTACVFTSSDNDNCGACGNKCTSPDHCDNGSCICTLGCECTGTCCKECCDGCCAPPCS